MEKLTSDWKSTSITTTFRVKLVDDQAAVCAARAGDRVYTEVCGLGWRFGMVYSSYSQTIMLEFDPYHAHAGLAGLKVTALLRSEKMKDEEAPWREMRPADITRRAFFKFFYRLL